jgi:hypothetical protein
MTIALSHLRSFPSVSESLVRDRQLIWHAQARLFARVSHPDSLMPSESYDVDLSKARFTGLYENRFSSGGPAQLIATFTPSDSTWLWGFENKSVAEKSWHDLRVAMRHIETLSPLLDERKFVIDEDDATKLATWVALKSGYLGAYPAKTTGANGDVIAFLAVKLTTHPEASPEPSDNQWCTLCGCTPDRVAFLLRGEHGYVCDECVDKHEPLVPSDPDPNVNYAADSSMPSCVMCDADSTPRIMHAYSSLCWDCIGTAANILREQR